MNTIKKWAYKILYALPFGMKAADNEIMGSQSIGDEGQSIHQEVSDERVAKHLLKGEISQSVKELRYRTYKVDDEAKNYEYLGGGTAIKKETKPVDTKRIHFSQECKLIASDVLEELKRVGTYGTETYTLQISYDNPLVKFKLEQFANQIDVDINEETKEVTTTLHFSNIPDGYEKKSAPFINELKRLLAIYNNAQLMNDKHMADEVYKHNEIASSMISLNFTTYKATNDEPDLKVYSFISPSLTKVEESNAEIRLTFTWETYDINDLKAKFFDEKMAKKYETNEAKNTAIDISGGQVRVAHCDVCGKEINTYDADVTKYTYGKAMCKDCLQNYLLSQLK